MTGQQAGKDTNMKTYVVVYWSYLRNRAYLKSDEIYARSAQEAVNIVRAFDDFESIVEVAVATRESWHCPT